MSQLTTNPDIQPFARAGKRDSLEDLQEKHGISKIYQLANNENPLGPSPRVIDAIGAVAPTLSYYPDYSDIGLRQAIVRVLGRGLTTEHIYTGCSGFESLELIARGFLRPGDELILCSPTFTGAYKKISEPLGARVVDVPLAPDSFAYRVDAVLEAINEGTRLIMLCNPNNPTGTVMPSESMDALMRGIPEHVLVVADEVYHHFVDDPAYPDSLRYVLEGKNIVVVHSFSKAYGLAGLRLGYGIAKPDLANYIAGLHRGFHQNKLALAAGIAACGDQEHVHKVVSYLRAEARWVCAELERMGIRYWKPAANFVMFETHMPGDDLQRALLERGFLLRAQTRNELPNAVRLSLGTREANQAFLGALRAILKESS
ncbi:MAG: histidinol-phosphate transaminase [Chloroflexi bacterium]|nr:histidinol-phosphate transaminase [Chloroflexota bacterium]